MITCTRCKNFSWRQIPRFLSLFQDFKCLWKSIAFHWTSGSVWSSYSGTSIPRGDSEFFICPTLMTRRKTSFSKFFSCYVAVKISVHCSWTKSITLVLFAIGRVSRSHSDNVLGKYSFTRNSSLVESNDHFKMVGKSRR